MDRKDVLKVAGGATPFAIWAMAEISRYQELKMKALEPGGLQQSLDTCLKVIETVCR